MGASGVTCAFQVSDFSEPDDYEPTQEEPEAPWEDFPPEPHEPFEPGERRSEVRIKGIKSPKAKSAKPKPAKPHTKKSPRPKKSPKPVKAKPPAVDNGWQTQLTRTPRGGLAATAGNAALILANDPAWVDVVAFDAFAGRTMKLRAPQWHKTDRPGKFYRQPGPWTDLDAALLRMWFERRYDLLLRQNDVDAAVTVHAHRQIRGGPADYLKALVWDRTARLSRVLPVYGGAKDTPYVRAVGAMWFISAVARAFDPGCQVDHGIILEGEQGIGKSSFLRLLAPEPAWFLVDIGSEFGKLDAFQKLRGKWIVEMSELDSLTRSQLSAAKAYWTNRVDTYRRSYGANPEDYPRRCVFAGTTNKDEYLTDDTGNRRFWPVLLTTINRERLRDDRDQLWAEAVARYRTGEEWHIRDLKLLAIAKREQEERVQPDPFERIVAGHLQDKGLLDTGVTTHEILIKTFAIKPRDLNRALETRVGGVLKKLGWSENGPRKWVGKHRVRRYFPPPEMDHLGSK